MFEQNYEHEEVLVVDDVEVNLEVIAELLADEGIEVIIAGSGETAVQRAKYALPSLILLDVMMPGIDGFETCRRLKSASDTCDIPVIFLTALTEKEKMVEGFRAGAVDYITKPIIKDELLARVKTHLEIVRLRRSLQDKLRSRTVELEQSEKRYNTLFQRAGMALFILSGTVVIDCNLKAREQLALPDSEIINRPFYSLAPPRQSEDVSSESLLSEIIERSLGDEDSQGYEWLFGLGKRTFQSELRLNRVVIDAKTFLLVMVMDVSAEKRAREMEQLMRQAGKMAELGALAAGVAHELRNPLTGIVQSLQVIEMRLYNKELSKNRTIALEEGLTMDGLSNYLDRRDITESLSMMKNLCYKTEDIIKNMLSFSRRAGAHFSNCDLGILIEETIELARFNSSFKKLRQIEVAYNGDVPYIQCRKSEIQQVLFNLISNAAEAMIELMHDRPGYKPRLTIEVECSVDGKGVIIKVEDNGPGIGPELQKTIFQPFYTTKGSEDGTGLGLYLAKELVQNHNGEIELESELGRGTTFIIKLPEKQEL